MRNFNLTAIFNLNLMRNFREYSDVHKATKEALTSLEEKELIEWIPSSNAFVATKLGKATVASALDPDEGLIVYSELSVAR